MRVVIDTNVLVSGIFWGGQPGRILDLWARDRVALLVSPPILSEYSRVLTDLGRREKRLDLAHRWLAFAVNNAVVVEVRSAVQQCRDPDDDKYLACALDGGAEWLISGDQDLLVLKRFCAIPIVTPQQFLRATT